MSIIKVIKKIPFFNGLNDEELQRIMEVGHEETVEHGQLLFEEGDIGDQLYIIMAGQVHIFHTEDGEEITISTLEKGGFFGEMALITGHPRSASAKSLTLCHLFVLEREYFLNLLNGVNPILFQIVHGLSSKVDNISHNFVVTSLQKQHIEDQAEIKRHQSISQMVAGVAHEINTPIGIAFQGANLISDELSLDVISGLAKNEDDEKLLIAIFNASKLIQTNILRADKLIKSFKNLSVRQFIDTLEQVDLKELVEELIVLYPAQKTGSKLIIEIDNRLAEHEQWLGYPSFLTQILLNLINNAQIHAYSGDKPETVKITLKSKKNNFILQVQDFGCGISSVDLDQVFTAFYTTKRGQGGTGLGMAIVYNLVTSELQGKIDIKSKLGLGTTITIKFPKRLEVKK